MRTAYVFNGCSWDHGGSSKGLYHWTRFSGRVEAEVFEGGESLGGGHVAASGIGEDFGAVVDS
jgi:hypothetical protein